MTERAADPQSRPAWADDLAAFETHTLALLARGAADTRSPLHTIAFASSTADGGPAVRNVILRAFDRSARTIRVHTDQRAAKVAAIRSNPSVALLAWDPGSRLQIRLTGSASLHIGDALAKAAWTASAPTSRMTYAQQLPPATPLILPTDVPPPDAAGLAPDAGFDQFAAVVVHIDYIDALWLGRAGHRRAAFTRQDPEWSRCWLAP